MIPCAKKLCTDLKRKLISKYGYTRGYGDNYRGGGSNRLVTYISYGIFFEFTSLNTQTTVHGDKSEKMPLIQESIE